MENLWVLQKILDPQGTGSVQDEPVTVVYEEIIFSNSKFSYEDKIMEVDGIL